MNINEWTTEEIMLTLKFLKSNNQLFSTLYMDCLKELSKRQPLMSRLYLNYLLYESNNKEEV